MTDKELRGLSRADLLELLIEETKKNQDLTISMNPVKQTKAFKKQVDALPIYEKMDEVRKALYALLHFRTSLYDHRGQQNI